MISVAFTLFMDMWWYVVQGHGTSEEGEGPHTLEACASDLHHLLTEEVKAKPHICAGHSFGGKVCSYVPLS